MSCHNVSRALLERFRFGELDADCDEYLEHVERCPDCQNEIAVDRAVAAQLRRALRERVDGLEPSPAVWRAVRLQATDPEPPPAWWAQAVLSLSRAMRVMVPATAVMLAAVLSFSAPEIGNDEPAGASLYASRMQWQEQLSATAQVENLEHEIQVIPSPTIKVPRLGGVTPYAEPVSRIKVTSGPPSTGGVIR